MSHRAPLSTILAADLTAVNHQVQIIERGTHAELMALDGFYTHLYDTQFPKSQDAA